MTEASAELPDPALRAALFEDAVGVLHERRVAPIVELCRAAGPQILKMQTAKKGNTMLHLAPSAVIAEVLLCLGADVLALNADGHTPRECAAPDNVELIAVLRAAEQDSLRRAPAVPSGAAVALAAAEGDDVQVLELLRQTLRSAEASATAERCAQLWSSLEGEQLVSAELHFERAGLTPPRGVATSPAAALLSDEGCPPAQATPEFEAVQQVQTMLTRTVEVITGLVAEDRVARDQAKLQQEQLHASILQAAQSVSQMQAFVREVSSKSVGPSAVGTRLDVAAQPTFVSPELVSKSASATAESSTPGTTEQDPDSGSDAYEYDDLEDADSKITTACGARQEGQSKNGANPVDETPIITAPPTALATQADSSNLEHWFAVDQAAQDADTIEVADVSQATMIPGTATCLYNQLASEHAGLRGTGNDSEIAATNSEQRPPVEVQHDKTAAAAVDAKLANLTFQKDSQLSSITSQHETSPSPTLGLTAARDTDTDPPATDALVASKPRAADTRVVELPRHERKALIEQHKRVKMVQTMFDKYARRDERSPSGAMGRKELSQLSKDSGSARIDSAYFRDTCEALRADPEVGISSEHLAQLYLNGGAWSATLVSDYKKIFGTKRVKVIAPPVTARPEILNAFVAGSNDDLDDV